MNSHFALQHYLGALAGVCSLALACGAGATDLNRCRDAQGHVLLTDQPCAQQGMEPDQVTTEAVVPAMAPALAPGTAAGVPSVAAGDAATGDGVAGTAAITVGSRDAQLPAIEPKRSPWADLPHPLAHRTVTLDAATLQAARNSVMMDDEMRRQRKIASAR